MKLAAVAYTAHRAVAEAGVQERILAAKDLESHIAGAADELRSLGDIAAGVFHADDIGNIGAPAHPRAVRSGCSRHDRDYYTAEQAFREHFPQWS